MKCVVCRKDKGRHFNGKIFKPQFERLNLKRKAGWKKDIVFFFSTAL